MDCGARVIGADEDPIADGGEGFPRRGGLTERAAESGPGIASGKEDAIEAAIFLGDAGGFEAGFGDVAVLLFEEVRPT